MHEEPNDARRLNFITLAGFRKPQIPLIATATRNTSAITCFVIGKA
jgi:hypothetical protein